MGPPMRSEPAMPPLEPSVDPAAAAMIDRAQRNTTVMKDAEFAFPADEDFWENFSEQAQLSPHGQRGPCFEVSASHKAGEAPLRVNQAFVKGFVSAWEQRNPHTVTVTGRDGEMQFHASHEFWADVVGKLRTSSLGKPPPPQGDSVRIKSSLHPDAPPVVARTEDWNDACDRWEQEQGCTADQRAARSVQRRREIVEKRDRDAREAATREAGRIRESLQRPTLLTAERHKPKGRASGRQRRDRAPSVSGSSDSSTWRPKVVRQQGHPRLATFALSPASPAGSPQFCSACGSSLHAAGVNAHFCPQCGQQLRGHVQSPLRQQQQQPEPSGSGAVRARGEGFWAYGVLHYHIHNPHAG